MEAESFSWFMFWLCCCGRLPCRWWKWLLAAPPELGLSAAFVIFSGENIPGGQLDGGGLPAHLIEDED